MPIVDVDYRTLSAQLQTRLYEALQERDTLKRRLSSTEAELNAAVDQIERLQAKLKAAEAERITDEEIRRAYPEPHRHAGPYVSELGGAFDG